MTVEQQLEGLGAELRRLHTSLDQQNNRSRLLERQLRQFEQQLTRQLENLLSEMLTRALPEGGEAISGLVSQLLVPRFADGGIVEGAGLVALAGEAGPEAVLPLRRGADGQLGVSLVSAQRPAEEAGTPAINIQITLDKADTDIGADTLADGRLLDGLSTHLSAALAQAVDARIEERLSAIGGSASSADIQAYLRASF